MDGTFPSELTAFTEITAVNKGVCPHDGHLLIEVDGEVMHLIPGDRVHAWRRAQAYIAEGHAPQAVVEAEWILRAAADG